ncbi:MAG: riboflavin kinase [Patescibacteria group bacterium]|nr:riboflavin kinase [Patescibacteria group bacterium]MDD5715568.1 riboflavin kinase [Patescibacteria group bacterium]
MRYIKGIVIPGDRYGRKHGYPTANIPWRAIAGKRIYAGVYIASVAVGDAVHPALVVIGMHGKHNPRVRKVEAHLLGFHGDLYGRVITIALRRKIRPLIRFSDPAGLMQQIKRDVVAARDYFRHRRIA